jgi:hypothetical protein
MVAKTHLFPQDEVPHSMPTFAAATTASMTCSPLQRILASDQARFIAFDPPDGGQVGSSARRSSRPSCNFAPRLSSL